MNKADPILVTRGQVALAGLIIGVIGAGMLIFVIWATFEITESNRERIGELERIERLEQPPTDEEIALAAEKALRVCARKPSCRRRFLLIVREEVLRKIVRHLRPTIRREVTRALERALRPAVPLNEGGGDDGPGGQPPRGGNPPEGQP